MSKVIKSLNPGKHYLDPLKELAKLVLKYIFQPKQCSPDTKSIIEQNIVELNSMVQHHKKHVAEKYGLDSTDYQPIGTKGTPIDEIEYFLQIICSWLVKDEQGAFEATKKLYKDHKIDYRKTAQFGWLFPEVYTRKDFAQAQEYLKEHMKAKPEYYTTQAPGVSIVKTQSMEEL